MDNRSYTLPDFLHFHLILLCLPWTQETINMTQFTRLYGSLGEPCGSWAMSWTQKLTGLGSPSWCRVYDSLVHSYFHILLPATAMWSWRYRYHMKSKRIKVNMLTVAEERASKSLCPWWHCWTAGAMPRTNYVRTKCYGPKPNTYLFKIF